MQVNNIKLIKEFGALVNAETISSLDQNKYFYLLESVKNLAEHKNYADAQYYLARHFLLACDIFNYKFWLMRAARNVEPHPLANLQCVKFSLKKYYELTTVQPPIAATYLAMAKNRLRFIMGFTTADINKRIDWIYVKEQADMIWQNEFAQAVEPVEIWSAPASSKLKQANHENYIGLAQQAIKISERIKDLLYRWQVRA